MAKTGRCICRCGCRAEARGFLCPACREKKRAGDPAHGEGATYVSGFVDRAIEAGRRNRMLNMAAERVRKLNDQRSDRRQRALERRLAALALRPSSLSEQEVRRLFKKWGDDDDA